MTNETDYEAEFADLPDLVGSGEAAQILDVAGRTGVHYILNNLPDDAPPVDVEEVQFGNRTYQRYRKDQLIALRRWRERDS